MSLLVPTPLRLLHLDRVDSTNRVALDAARAGEPEGLVVVADTQDAGRGRQGRAWIGEPERSLLFSVMLRPRVPLQEAWVYTLVAGLAALHAAEEAGVEGCWLKWPNDLYIGERKAGGVLCELHTSGRSLDAVVVGVGLNLDEPRAGWPADLMVRATSLAEAGVSVPRPAALLRLCEGILHWRRQYERGGSQALIRAMGVAMGPMVGRSMSVQSRGGTLDAMVLGIGQNGALRVRARDGRVHELLAGDVHLRW